MKPPDAAWTKIILLVNFHRYRYTYVERRALDQIRSLYKDKKEIIVVLACRIQLIIIEPVTRFVPFESVMHWTFYYSELGWIDLCITCSSKTCLDDQDQCHQSR